MKDSSKEIKELQNFYHETSDLFSWHRIDLYGIQERRIKDCYVKHMVFPVTHEKRIVPMILIDTDEEIIIYDPIKKGRMKEYSLQEQQKDSEFVVNKIRKILELDNCCRI